MKVKNIIDEIIGWYGTLAIISAFVMVSFELISPISLSYQIMNATGALGVAYISLKNKVYQPGVLNIIWALVAIIAILKLLF